MFSLRTIALGAILLLQPSAAAGQEPVPGLLELGAFGQYTNFHADAACMCDQPTNGVGIGGRIAYYTSSRWFVELDGQTTLTDRAVAAGDVRYSTGALRFNHAVPLSGADGGLGLLIGAGPLLSRIGGTSDWGVGGLAGLRWGVAPRVALRADGVADYVPDRGSVNLGVRVGLGVALRHPGRSGPAAPPPPAPRPDPAPRPPSPPPAEAAPPAAGPVRTMDTAVLTAPVHFDLDRDEIRPDARAVLEAKLPWLQANPGVRLLLEGHADDRGTTGYNIPLGERRARSAVDFLVGRGVDRARLEVVSYGDTRPVCTDRPAGETCHQANRRVEFRFVALGEDGLVVPR